MKWWRKVPVDLVAFVAIVVVVVVTHLRVIRHGMCWNDPSWYFHFGHRTLHGDVPYRDYVFQVGPLPIYVDAAFQELVGGRYTASLFAGLLVKILRTFVMWLLVRRLVDWRAAVAIVVFCVLDPAFAFVHHWSTSYSQLFMTLSGLCFLLASRNEGRRQLLYLALAGLNAGLVVSSRQSSAVMIGVVLFAATAILLARKKTFTPRMFASLWGGFAAALVLVFGALALAGALGPAIQQMFLDAPQKKAIHGIDAMLDAISGGALVDWNFSWWGGFLYYLGLPIALVASVTWLAARERPIERGMLAALVLPAAVALGLLTRDASLNFFSDVPRTFLTLTTALAVLWPDRLRRWFGLEPLIALGLGALPLASDWALEMSFPGRGWGDASSLVTGAVLLTLAATRLASRMKMIICGAFAAAGVLSLAVAIHADYDPFAKGEATDGTLEDNHLHSSNAVLRGLRINEPRKAVIDWLTSEVPPGSTCFVYGNLPVLYDLLRCKNPTRIDSTAADFITANDADEAVAILRAQPPDFLIAEDKQWMSPPLTLDLHDRLEDYGGLNPPASMAMHVGLRSLLDRYEPIGSAAELLGTELSKQASEHWDAIDGLRVYRRRR